MNAKEQQNAQKEQKTENTEISNSNKLYRNKKYDESMRQRDKPRQDSTEKENYKPIPLMNRNAKILEKMMANQIQKYIFETGIINAPSSQR